MTASIFLQIKSTSARPTEILAACASTPTVSRFESLDDIRRFSASAILRRSTVGLKMQALSTLSVPGLLASYAVSVNISSLLFLTRHRLNLAGRAALGKATPTWQTIGL